MDNQKSQELRDEELVALCQQGQGQYFDFLVRKYMEKAFRIAFDFTRDKEEARDLSQEAFLRAFSRIKQFDGFAHQTVRRPVEFLYLVLPASR
ncbi:MAG: hypothetical protein HYW03_09255 [Deltaproteobacteria bacterium]|nr:hypothetical protein [Deltaproteobacteria bacterium]